MPFELQSAQITIIGLGLMGGSLAAALTSRRVCRRVVGVTRRQETLNQALEMGIIHEGTCHLAKGVETANIVVLATPVRTIIRLIHEIGQWLPSDCVLTDVGSTKQAIVEAMYTLPPHVQPIGGHPMCGKEIAGLSAADPSLYNGAIYALTPLSCTSDTTVSLACDLVQAIGARPLLLDPSCHDQLVAAVSHLPYLVAIDLIRTAEDLANDLVWSMVASGFRDTTRLAASDETMMLDALLTNRSAVCQMLAQFQVQLADLAQRLKSGDEAGLLLAMSTAAERRRRLYH